MLTSMAALSALPLRIDFLFGIVMVLLLRLYYAPWRRLSCGGGAGVGRGARVGFGQLRQS